MTTIINLPLLVALSGLLVWLYATYLVQRITAAIPAYTTVSPKTWCFQESKETVQW